MCEFRVLLENETIFEGAVYAKATGSSVKVRDIIGSSREIGNVKIVEVDVTKERLVLERL
ncbi:CooT family nickel-binding protein [Candidatus Bathyarchaeota archaeon]|nr:CooT family nickel-binding protein [Candidatus Bathyarchaeota archaeon]